MKSTLSQVIYSVNSDNLLSMVLLQPLQEVLTTFNIVLTVEYLSTKSTCLITPINKDGEPQKQIEVKLDEKFNTLKSKNRDLYVVLLLGKIFYHLEQNIYNYFSFSFFNEHQYVNLLMLSLSQSIQKLQHSKSNRDLFNTIAQMNILNSAMISSFALQIQVKSIELVLSDDLYRYIGYELMKEPCRGMKNSYDKRTLFGYPFKISVDTHAYLDFFMLKINDFEIYKNIIHLEIEPAFYLPLHIFEPITCTKSYDTSEVLQKGSTLFKHQDFIEITITRIFQAIELLNSSQNIISPMSIKNHYSTLSLPSLKEYK